MHLRSRAAGIYVLPADAVFTGVFGITRYVAGDLLYRGLAAYQ
jgi:hypothetical protein